MHKYTVPVSVRLTFLTSRVRERLCSVQNMMRKIRNNSATFFSSPGKLVKNEAVRGRKPKVVHANLIVAGKPGPKGAPAPAESCHEGVHGAGSEHACCQAATWPIR